MARKQAICHPDREARALGLCSSCYQSEWRRNRLAERWKKLRRPCILCGTEYTPSRQELQRYCSNECQDVAWQFNRSILAEIRDLGYVEEERYATRDERFVRTLLRTAMERGCRPVHKNKVRARTEGPYVAAWHRGEGLYIVRVRWPEEQEEAA